MLSREHSEADSSIELEDSDEAGPAQALEIGGLVLRAPRRQPRVAAGVFALGVALTIAVVLLVPRVYAVDTTILVQRNVVIPLLGNPWRAVPSDWDVSGRVTSQSISRHDSLVALVKETDLGARWDVGRSPILKLNDKLAIRIFGPMSEKDMTHKLVSMVEQRLSVQVDDTTIKISITWDDPETAYRLVSFVEQSFLKERSTAAMAPIMDTITILETEETRQRETLAAAVAETHKLRLAAAAPIQPSSTPESRSSNEVADSSEGVDDPAETRRITQAEEAARQHRLAELQAQLAELRITYASAHPLVLAMDERIRQAEAVPPEPTPAAEGKHHHRRVKSLSPPNGGVREAPSASSTLPQMVRLVTAESDDPPELTAARARLASALKKHDELRERIESARMELQTAQAAFKYGYAITRPPELPKSPAKPNTLVILAGGLAASFVLAVASAVAKDVASDRFIEPWQVRQRLPIPLLAELEGP